MEQPIEIPPELLVGHWRAVQGALTVDWIFNGDGSFTGNLMRQGQLISKFAGDWQLDGAYLYSEYTADSSGLVEVGSNDRDVFLEFTMDYFVVQTRTGKRRYVRIP